MTSLDTDLLSDLLRKKHDLLCQIRDFGERQLELIAGDDMTQLLKLLAAKQRLIDALHGLERGLDPFRDQDPDVRLWRAQADRDQCAHWTTRSEELLAEIVSREKQSETDLAFRRDEAAQRLQGAQRAWEARGAYVDDSKHLTGSLDLSSDR